MVDSVENELRQEYLKKWRIYLPMVKIGAFNKFDIENGQFVSITRFSQIYAFIVIIMVNITGYFVIYETSIKNDFLTQPEVITIIELWIINNLVLLNIHLFNKNGGVKVIEHFIELDLFLGVKQTKFMRDIVTKDVLLWAGSILLFEVGLAHILILSFNLPLYIYVTGAIFFQLLFSLCYDQILHVIVYKFLCLRVHYLNVGLVKIANLNTEYLMDQLLLYPLFWKKEYDNYVDKSNKNPEYFTEILGRIVDQVRCTQNCFRFMILLCITSLVFGTFLAVQTIIILIKNPEVQLMRTFSLTSWFVVSWFLFIAISDQSDKLNLQIQRTKLICTYIQLKPNNSDELFHLSRSILDKLSVNDYRISIYDLFYFNKSLLRSVVSSLFVYITMQLQIAFPKI